MNNWKEHTDYYVTRLKGPYSEDAYHYLIEADDSIIPSLIDAFRNEHNLALRSGLVEIIWQHRNPDTIAFLSEALNDAASEVWKSALDGLIALACSRAVEALRSARSRVFPKKKQTEEFQRWLEEAIEQAEDKINVEQGRE